MSCYKIAGTVSFICVLAFFSCKKNNTNNTAKGIDTMAIVERIAGPHTWTGTLFKTGHIDSVMYPDTSYAISFDCAIEVINQDTIFFANTTPETQKMGLLSMNMSDSTLLFTAYYEAPNYAIHSFDTIVFNFANNSLMHLDMYSSHPNGYTYRKVVHSP